MVEEPWFVDKVHFDQGGGKLEIWIDFERDGDWSDPKDHAVIDTLVNTASYGSFLPFETPAFADPGLTFARIRISSVPGLSYNGPAPDG